MRILKKVLIGLLFAILLSQIPFIYNRWQIGNLTQKIIELNSVRIEAAARGFKDYKGVIHVHTSIGGHSTGTFTELIDAANKNELDFVVMTEHAEPLFDTSALSLKGLYGKTLFINGQEVSTPSCERFLVLPGNKDSAKDAELETPKFLEKYKTEGKMIFAAYPEKLKYPNADFDGIEVFSLHTNAKEANPIPLIFDVMWSFSDYPEATLASHLRRPDINLEQYDEISRNRRITLFAGNDAHSNIGFHLLGSDAGDKLINFKIDRYETIFRPLRTHIFLEEGKPLTDENLLEALKDGRSYISIDFLGDATGFDFTANNGFENGQMGSEMLLRNVVILHSQAPLDVRFVLFKNGEKIHETSSVKQFDFETKEPGVYRVEAYLDSLGSPFNKMPWIISNPIYIR